MSRLMGSSIPALALSLAFIAAPALAGTPMRGMHMPASQQVQSVQAKAAHGANTGHAPRPGKHAAHGANLPMQAAPKTTGTTQTLGIGSEIGIRPVLRGLGLEPMPAGMQGMRMQGGHAPPGARSADYSDGIGYTSMTGMDMQDDAPLGMLLFDRLEYFDGREDTGAAFDIQAWYGNDANKLWLKAEGERSAGRLQTLRVESLWDRPVSTYWDTQLGLRHDAGSGPDRNWLAFGVQGLAPYWFEVQATAYIGPSGRTALRFESEYELRLTQRLILQPRFEANLYGHDDPQRGIASGLSKATVGLRLRYEITRQFAPYLGVEFERKFGATARYAHGVGEPAFDSRLVAGLRIWL